MHRQFAAIYHWSRSTCSSPAMAAAVALVAVHAVVDIAIDVRVMEIVRVPASVATRTLENGVVIRVGVAGGAHSNRIAVVRRELRVLPVIERRIQPVRGAMAILTSRWEELRLRRV